MKRLITNRCFKMGLFDRFKKDKKDKKEKKVKEIPKDIDIPDVELQLKDIAMNSKNRNERAVMSNRNLFMVGPPFSGLIAAVGSPT